MSGEDLVRVERAEGAESIAILTINRPDKRNALNLDVLRQLQSAVQQVRTSRGVRVLVVTGAGEKAFVAGADIALMKDMRLEQARELAQLGHAAFDAIESLPFPAIAAVNGFALGGGCELALACDFVYASETAVFGQPEVKLGVIPGFGGTQRLLRRVGLARAKELVFTGATIDAPEALRIGLVNKVVPPTDLMKVVLETASAIAKAGPLAVAEAKKVMREGDGRLLRDANALEVEGFAGCFETEDQKEGMAAFLEKRPAAFRAE